METKSIKQIQNELAAPFTKEVSGKIYPAHKWKPQAASRDGKKMMCIAYLDRDLVIQRLNSVLGVDGWQFDVKELSDGSKVGTLSIKVNGMWIDKSDVGTKTAVEGEKGSVTDALKRCASLFGVGTYLYNLGSRWVDAMPGGNGKPQPCNNGKILYGDDLSNYINGMSSAQGLMYQIFSLRPDLKEDQEAKNLWFKLA